MKFLIRHTFPILIMVGTFTGCDSQQQLNNELLQARAELRHLRAEHNQVQSRIKGVLDNMATERTQCLNQTFSLRQRIQALESQGNNGRKNSACQFKAEDLTAWAKAMHKAIGPAVWIPAQYEQPMFDKTADDVSVQGIIGELNQWMEQHKSPTLIFKQREGDTVLVGISDEDQLGERMGSFGARAYLNAALYSLSSLTDIHCVRFDFKEGSHAVPGKRCLQ